MINNFAPVFEGAKLKEYQPVKPAEVIFWEGPDYSGKTTQIKKVAEHIEGYGLKVLIVKEPGGTPLSKHIRKILLDTDIAKEEEMDYLTRRLLYAASYTQGIKYIKENIDNYDYIFCDRYTPLSDMVYSYMSEGEYKRSTKRIVSSEINGAIQLYLSIDEQNTNSVFLNSRLILLNLNVDRLEDRVKARIEEGAKLDVNDIKGMDFKRMINQNYQKIVDIYNNHNSINPSDATYLRNISPFAKVNIIDANREVGEVFHDAFSLFKESVLERIKAKIR